MPTDNKKLLLCYNRGCGNKFDPDTNKDDSCTHHPGVPVFHDAYKGWSCCDKKCTDFTEFLNIKGCTKSKHSNIKPVEPEKPAVDKSKADKVIEYKAPQPSAVTRLTRPSVDLPLSKLKCDISNSLKEQFESIIKKIVNEETDDGNTALGTNCHNGGCKTQYTGPEVNTNKCIYHPGVPIFHEGLKFWSCCQKRTTDFNAFLDQVGCETGQHLWQKQRDPEGTVQCRHDWHQTSSHVIVSVYAKKFDPYKSTIELNPVRLKIYLWFPEEEKKFELDLELRGIVDVEASECSMLPTKTEIKLKKAEPMSWPKLDFPRQQQPTPTASKAQNTTDEQITPQLDAVDLSDL